MRAVAIAGVMALHAHAALPGGHLGVSVFFVLSGYIITSSLLVERERRGRVDLFSFYVRRSARLIPPLIPSVLVLAALLLYRGGSVKAVAEGVGASLLYVSNLVRTVLGNGWLGGYGWTWTLALEEQFYLVWPVVLLLTLRRSRSWSLAVAAAGVVIPAVLRFFLPTFADPVPAQLYYGPHSRVSGLMLGCVLALVLNARPVRMPARLATLCSTMSLIMIGAAFWFGNGANRGTYLWWLPAVEVASAVLIVAVVASPANPVARLLGVRPLAYLGLISYGIYLWNAVFFDQLDQSLHASFGIRVAVWIALTLAISAASYHWLESPIRRLARNYLRARGEPAVSHPEVAAATVAEQAR